MKVSRIKINGIVNPIGYSFDKICCSWLVSETEAKKTIHVKIDVAKEETFGNILYSKEGAALNAACEQLDLILEARTRYYVRIAVTGDNKEQNEDMPVKEVICTPAGETVLDFGQNFAGYVTFRSELPKGTKVVLDFGEILQKGNFYNANYRRAKSQFTYVSDGRKELVKPQFTYFGFRYVRVTGWVGELDPSAFMGRALYSDMKVTGHVETGNKKVNQLFSNIMWGQKSNSIDFPTDCPQRDERLGWTGDAQVFAGTASYNMDTAAFYHKFLHDLRTEQKKLDGILPGVIPVFDPAGAAFAAVWGDIATFLPAVLYEHYGDKTALETYYPMMKDWVDKITREDQARGQRYLFDYGNQIGDWLALDARTQQNMKGGTDDYFIGAGIYEFEYQPVEDLRCRYTKKTLFKEMLQDEKAMEVIERISPMLQQFLTSGDEEFLHESLSTLEGMFFLGFSPEMIREMTEELTLLR